MSVGLAKYLDFLRQTRARVPIHDSFADVMNASRSWLRGNSSFIYRRGDLGKMEANDNNTEPNEPSTWESGSGKPGSEAVTNQADLVTRPSPEA